jgi:hypothetical protein
MKFNMTKLNQITLWIISLFLSNFHRTGALAPISSRRDWWKQSATAATVVVLSNTVNNNPMVANAATEISPLVLGSENIMTPKAHGTSEVPVQSNLQYGVSVPLADRICNYNRRFAEPAGYFESTNLIERMVSSRSEDPVTFYDSVTGKPLFVAPIGRTANQFIAESKVHGTLNVIQFFSASNVEHHFLTESVVIARLAILPGC